LRHAVGLVQDNDFERWAWVLRAICGVKARWLGELGSGEVLDFVTYYADAAFV
jgi:hypothetical protein